MFLLLAGISMCFCLGLNVFLSGVIFYRVFPDKPFYAYLASIFVFLSLSSLRIHATISSDPFYLTLTLGFSDRR